MKSETKDEVKGAAKKRLEKLIKDPTLEGNDENKVGRIQEKIGPVDWEVLLNGIFRGKTVIECGMATAVAMTDCSLDKIDKPLMARLLHEHHDVAELFVKHLLLRNIRYEADLVDQLFNSSEKRLARILLLIIAGATVFVGSYFVTNRRRRRESRKMASEKLQMVGFSDLWQVGTRITLESPPLPPSKAARKNVQKV